MQYATRNTEHAARHVIIVGGGITGLSAAWWLERLAAARALPLKVTVLEASGKWGGKIVTEPVDMGDGNTFLVEGGPDSFLTRKPWALQLARELGIEARMLPTNARMKTVHVLHRDRPLPMPDGMVLAVPTRAIPFLRSPLISLRGKARMALDWLLPARRAQGDESLGAFIRRRLGREALETLAEPMMAGIYSADAERQSLLATFPNFREMERRHSSLIRAATRMREQVGVSAIAAFVAPAGGTAEVIDALTTQLESDLRLHTRVTGLDQRPGGGWRVMTEDGDALEADAILLTTPAYSAAALLEAFPEAARELAAIRHVGSGTISLAFRAEEVTRPLGGFGLVIPQREERSFNALTVCSEKFGGRAPSGYLLLRLFFGGSRRPELMDCNNDELLALARAELRDILGIQAEPLFHRVYRWERAHPQYDVGHLERVSRIERSLPRGIHVAGCAMRGVGIPDCVRQGQLWAEKVVDKALRTSSTPLTLESNPC